MSKKILTISREYPPNLSGVAKYLSELIKRCEEFDFEILSYYSESKLPMPFKSRYLKAIFFIITSFIKSMLTRSDVILANSFASVLCAVPVKFVKQSPLVSIIHDIDGLFENSPFGELNRKFRVFLMNISLTVSDAVVVPSDNVRENISENFGVDLKKIHVVPNGVKTPKIENIEILDKGNKKIVMFLGALLEKKGVEYLIRAFRYVRDEHENVELWLVGSRLGSYHKKLEDIISNLDLGEDVVFFGRVESIWPYMKTCDIFVFPSVYGEGFGRPVVEASAMGKPVVTTDLIESNDVVNEDTGIVVRKKDPNSIAEALNRLLNDDKFREKLGENGRDFSKRFNWNSSSEKFRNILLNEMNR